METGTISVFTATVVSTRTTLGIVRDVLHEQLATLGAGGRRSSRLLAPATLSAIPKLVPPLG